MSSGRVFANPVLPGFHPDPSVCRVGQDFYLVTSTFAYFPGVPVFHSRDLVNWRQIGNALSRPEQLDLDGAEYSAGIFAPSIRHNGGVFYLITTNMTRGGTFVVTAKDPAGPWSDPHWLTNAPGFDPSLFFDDDGKAWYCGTRPAPEGVKYNGNWEVWFQEFDPAALQLVGEPWAVWRGALRDCAWPEGPHIYKKGDWYILLISEGGTAEHHALSVARSRSLRGPWVGNPGNPILTHRHLGRNCPVVNVGHGDMIDCPDGSWWMVLLASRPYGGYFRNLGRETFLTPVSWEDDWPVVSPGLGRLAETYPAPALPETPVPAVPACEHFEDAELAPHWLFVRTPRERFWSLDARAGHLRLHLRSPSMRDRANPSFVGRRQLHQSWRVSTSIEFVPEAVHETAGLVLLQSDDYHYRMELASADSRSVVRVVACEKGVERTIAEAPCHFKRTVLTVQACGQDLSFLFGSSPGSLQLLADHVDGRILNTDRAGGFVGTVLGIFASSNGHVSDRHADFDWFEYSPA